ncbi:hypothetical protein CLF_108011 [Clonorchis sinensis]|uniref:Uncharacterized protein n=1 Tax=Clonorchis sinensis TaxID=79923 RepID=G7YHI0_CLOSI|nr:hypothetical protein CLF_108011 [Clonorchis sinensis]
MVRPRRRDLTSSYCDGSCMSATRSDIPGVSTRHSQSLSYQFGQWLEVYRTQSPGPPGPSPSTDDSLCPASALQAKSECHLASTSSDVWKSSMPRLTNSLQRPRSETTRFWPIEFSLGDARTPAGTRLVRLFRDAFNVPEQASLKPAQLRASSDNIVRKIVVINLGYRDSSRSSEPEELISSSYAKAVPGFEFRTSDMRGERATTTPPTNAPEFSCLNRRTCSCLNDVTDVPDSSSNDDLPSLIRIIKSWGNTATDRPLYLTREKIRAKLSFKTCTELFGNWADDALSISNSLDSIRRMSGGNDANTCRLSMHRKLAPEVKSGEGYPTKPDLGYGHFYKDRAKRHQEPIHDHIQSGRRLDVDWKALMLSPSPDIPDGGFKTLDKLSFICPNADLKINDEHFEGSLE